jgi:hypothetical protein
VSTAASPEAGKRVLGAGIVACVAYVASPVAGLVAVEVIELRRPALGQRTPVAVAGIEAVVHVAVEAGMAVKPGSCPNKQAADKPVRPVVAVGSTVIGRVVKVPIGADGRHSDADCNLGWRHVGGAEKRNTESGQDESFAES